MPHLTPVPRVFGAAWLAFAAGAAGALAPGCADAGPLPSDFGQCEAAGDPDAAPQAPTWHRDVAPLLAASCTSCHSPGGSGPGVLSRYADAAALAGAIADEVVARRMPPWPPGACCADWRDQATLDATAVETLRRWAASGAPAGDPADAPPVVVGPGEVFWDAANVLAGTALIELPMEEAYTPTVAAEQGAETRCFLLDWDVPEARYAIGWDVAAGTPGQVQRAAIYRVARADRDALRALDAAAAGPGWGCAPSLGLRAQTLLGSWRPDAGATRLRDGLGRRVEATDELLLQIRYRVDPGAAARPDVSTARLVTATAVATPLRVITVTNPMWLLDSAMAIPAGAADARHWFAVDPSDVDAGGASFTLYGVTPLMHDRGASWSLARLPDGGAAQCLMHVPAWRTEWFGQYLLDEPVRFTPGDRVELECHWDNSAAGARDLAWGDEVCLALLLIGEAP